MGMIYLVRKKIFRTAEGMKQLYYAVQRTLQPRGGVTTEQLARRMAARKGVTEGDAHSILQDLPRFVAEALKEACSGRDTVVIASTDMSHYIPKEDAARLDGMVLDEVSRMDVQGMYGVVYGNRVSMCGYGPTATAMLFSEGCVPRMLGHTDSYDALGMDPGAVVGYASAVFERGQYSVE